jgi:hypothetical protein
MKDCFVIMPISSGEMYDVYKNRYEHIIRPAVETFLIEGAQVYNSVRADYMSQTGSINKSVIQKLYNSELVIADLTDLNPNVFYELGVRHSLRNGTILTALKGTKPPFDIGDISVVFFEDRVGGEKEAIPQLQEKMKGIHNAQRVQDSPIFDAIPDLDKMSMRETSELRGRLHSAESEAQDLRMKLSVAEAVNVQLRGSLSTFERTIESFFSTLAPGERENAASRVRQAAESVRPTRAESISFTHITQDESLAFVLMPFDPQLEPVYHAIRSGLQAAAYSVMRADSIVAPGRIVDQISEMIARAGLIVADISGNNANVMLEIGISQSLGKRLILISSDSGSIPFDVASYRVLIYDNSPQGLSRLSEQLAQAASAR